MKPLESRKQLLLAESELNRAQMVGDLTALTTGVRTLTHRATHSGTMASSAALLALGLTFVQRGQPASPVATPSKINCIVNGAVLLATLWLAVSAQRNGPREL